MTVIELKDIRASYGETTVLRDFSLAVASGEFVALLGNSGCGKTTILKIIAGLIEAQAGEISFDGENVTRKAVDKRGVAMVFQKPLLFPFLNVADNVAFGLKMRRMPSSEIKNEVASALQLVQMQGFERRFPSQLSGGQEQRIAIARAIITKPRVLLLDEPFSALDLKLRVEMRNLISDLQKRLNITTVFVTHDQDEAVAIADKIAFVDNGKATQISAPNQFFTNPQTIETARFFGWKIINGIVNNDLLQTDSGDFDISDLMPETTQNQNVRFAFHPHQAKFSSGNGMNNPDIISFEAESTRILNLGAKNRYFLRLQNGETFEIEEAQSDENDNICSKIKIIVPRDSVRFFVEK